MRPSMLDVLHDITQILSTRSTCSARASVGAVLFDDHGRIYGSGYNGSPVGMPHCDDVGCDLDADGHCKNAVHAEINAILQCAKMGRSTDGLSIFITHSPCIRCANIIVQAGIRRVVYIKKYASDWDNAALLFQKAGVVIEQYGTGDYR